MSYASAEVFEAVKLPGMFEQFWNLAEQWIEEPNARRKGRSGVIRATFCGEAVYVKKQFNHLHFSPQHPIA